MSATLLTAVGRLAKVYQMRILGLRRRTELTSEEALVVVSDRSMNYPQGLGLQPPYLLMHSCMPLDWVGIFPEGKRPHQSVFVPLFGPSELIHFANKRFNETILLMHSLRIKCTLRTESWRWRPSVTTSSCPHPTRPRPMASSPPPPLGP